MNAERPGLPRLVRKNALLAERPDVADDGANAAKAKLPGDFAETGRNTMVVPASVDEVSDLLLPLG